MWRDLRLDPPDASTLVLQRLSDVTKPPVPIVRLAHQLGVRICRSHRDVRWRSVLDLRSGAAVLWIAGEDKALRRFCVAHAVAHLIHHPIPFLQLHYDTTFRRSVHDQEANEYAAELLMPDPWLWPMLAALESPSLRRTVARPLRWVLGEKRTRKILGSGSDPVDPVQVLAERFGVPEDVVLLRLQSQ
jgi:hypothetical protein